MLIGHRRSPRCSRLRDISVPFLARDPHQIVRIDHVARRFGWDTISKIRAFLDEGRVDQLGSLMHLLSFLRTRFNPVAMLTAAIVLVGGAGVGTAATGGTFTLGRSNS